MSVNPRDCWPITSSRILRAVQSPPWVPCGQRRSILYADDMGLAPGDILHVTHDTS